MKPSSPVKRLVDEPGDTAALDAAVAAGATSLPAIVDTLAASKAVPTMTALLSMLDLPIEALEPLLARTDGSVAPAALTAIARIRDPRVLSMIRGVLPREEAAVVVALGNHGDPAAIETIAKIVADNLDGVALPGADWLDDRVAELRVVVKGAVAMAKLGDQRFVPLVCHLATLSDAQEPLKGDRLRTTAVIALSYLTGPGVASAVHQALSDPSRDVVIEALRSSLYIGRIAEAEGIMQVIRDGGELAGTATSWLKEWAGTAPSGKLDEWWTKTKSQFSPGVSYRLGKPIDLGVLVKKLPDDPLYVRDELRIHTGAACFYEGLSTDPVSSTERAAVDAWWKAHAGDFPPGKLYRWGRTFDPDAVDR